MPPKIPKPSFSKWIELSEFIEAGPLPARVMGVYLISKKKPRAASRRPVITDPDIIYIGMSTSTLRNRLRSFYRAACRSGRGHSGGRKVAEKFGSYKNGWSRKSVKLYVSYWAPYGQREKEMSYRYFKQMGIVTYLEYRYLGQYYKKHLRTPVCNANRRGQEIVT